MEANVIYNEDCLEGMTRLDDHSIDMVICDLPYGVLNRKNDSAGWDSVISFSSLWDAYERVVKDDGAIVLFGQGMFTANLMESNPDMWRYNLIWEKDRPTGFLNSKRMPLRSHEDIMVFYKKQPTYNPQMVFDDKHRNHPIGNGKHTDVNQCYGNFARAVNPVISDYKFPRSVIRVKKEHDSGTVHPTQKPVALIEYLIRTYSNEGELVLDNCMGSGTTAIAALRCGRRYIGFETDGNYCDVANKRVDEFNEKIRVNSLW